jgi:hypothetical protein
MAHVPDAHARNDHQSTHRGPSAEFCGYEFASENGERLRCRRLRPPPNEPPCDHGLRPRPRRDQIIAKLRQDIAEAQGVHQRVEGERETLREKAKEAAA